MDTSKLVLYIGEGVAEGKLADSVGTSTGYINTVSNTITGSSNVSSTSGNSYVEGQVHSKKT